MSTKGRPIIIKKKKSGGHGHHGGAWKVAYADFVTAMMALFMVMWLLASTDSKSRQEIANYFRSGVLPEGDLTMGKAAQLTPAIVEETGRPPPPDRRRRIEEQADDLREAVEAISADPAIAAIAGQVSVSVTDDGVLIEAVDTDGQMSLLFDVASARLKPALVELLEGLAPVLAAQPGVIEVIGHTDARPYAAGGRSGPRDNWELSFERAAAARRVLEVAGVPAGRIQGVVARADAQLRADDPLAAENRRLGVLVRPELDRQAADTDGRQP